MMSIEVNVTAPLSKDDISGLKEVDRVSAKE